MIRTHFDDLRRAKAYREKRDLSLRTIAAETGLSINTIQRLRKGQTERVGLATLDALCRFFGLTNVGELIEYVPEEETE